MKKSPIYSCGECKSFKNDRCFHRVYKEDYPNGLILDDYEICSLFVYDIKKLGPPKRIPPKISMKKYWLSHSNPPTYEELVRSLGTVIKYRFTFSTSDLFPPDKLGIIQLEREIDPETRLLLKERGYEIEFIEDDSNIPLAKIHNIWK